MNPNTNTNPNQTPNTNPDKNYFNNPNNANFNGVPGSKPNNANSNGVPGSKPNNANFNGVPGSNNVPSSGSQFSTAPILMILGVLLISISGIIFVSSKWDYFTSPVKTAILLGSSILFFLAAFIGPIRKGLPLASNIFYYLGTLFLGLSAVMLFGGFTSAGNYYANYDLYGSEVAQKMANEITVHNCKVLFMLCLGIIIPIAVKFYFNRFAGDILISVLLLNVLAITFPIVIGLLDNPLATGIIAVLISLILLSVTILKVKYFNTTPTEIHTDRKKHKDTLTVIRVLYGIEAGINIIFSAVIGTAISYEIESFMTNILSIIAITTVFASTYISYKHAYNTNLKTATFQRIVNSFMALIIAISCAMTLAAFIFYGQDLSYSDHDYKSTVTRFIFTIFFLMIELVFEYNATRGDIDYNFVRNVNLPNGEQVQAVHLKHAFKRFRRHEFFYATIVYVSVIQLVEIISYEFSRGFFGSGEYDTNYLPFSFVIAAFFVGLALIRKNYDLIIPAVAFSISGFIMIFAAYDDDYLGSATFMSFATIFILCGSLVKNKVARSILYTITLLNVIFSLTALPFLHDRVDLLGDECILAPTAYALIYLLAIVMIKYIWYYSNKAASNIQFVGIILLFVFLFIYNLADGDILTLLTQSIIAIVILIGSAHLQNKRYLLLSSITLGLTVVYLTRDFWMSLAWWIYLFIGGIALVAFAVYKELKKR